MKKILLLISLIAVSCSSNPDYDANLDLAKKWVQAFETGDIELWKEVVSEDVKMFLLCTEWEELDTMRHFKWQIFM